jgi:hypothetical protein
MDWFYIILHHFTSFYQQFSSIYIILPSIFINLHHFTSNFHQFTSFYHQFSSIYIILPAICINLHHFTSNFHQFTSFYQQFSSIYIILPAIFMNFPQDQPIPSRLGPSPGADFHPGGLGQIRGPATGRGVRVLLDGAGGPKEIQW